MPLLFALLGSALISWLLGWPVYHFLVKREIIDRPNERSSHDRPTARGGGIAIMAAILVGAGVLSFQYQDSILLLGTFLAFVVSGVSFLDDLKSVPAHIRFGCHAAAATCLLLALPRPMEPIELLPRIAFGLPWLIACPLFFVWITGYTNAFNFMDGINGIAAGQAFITGTGMALLAGFHSGNWSSPAIAFALIIAGASLGFLPHNFPKAKMFMGDVSSAPLGLLLALVTLWLPSQAGWDLLIPFLLLQCNFILDTSVTLVRRILKGEKWYLPHREHFYQRLVRAGKSHTAVTGLEMGLQVLCLAVLIASLQAEGWLRILAFLSIPFLWLSFFGWVQFTLRKALRSQVNSALGQSAALPA